MHFLLSLFREKDSDRVINTRFNCCITVLTQAMDTLALNSNCNSK
jgi:hypothetical protein